MRPGDAVWCVYPLGTRIPAHIVRVIPSDGTVCHAHPGAAAFLVQHDDDMFRGVYCAPQLAPRGANE